MTKEMVLDLLTEDAFISGQQISEALGVSRAAVWKAVQKLRAEGYAVESVTRKGYRLLANPEKLTRKGLCKALGDHPWSAGLILLDTVDSTNTYAKALAAGGAPHGTVVLANRQTGGRGRMGRLFSSPPDVGIYCSVIFRYTVPPERLLTFTAVMAEAACEAVAEVTGTRPSIKWTNDLVLGKKKLAGLLTELSVEAESGLVSSLVFGIGLNCNHLPEDFPPDVREVATSLRQGLGMTINRERMAAALIRQLARASQELFSQNAKWLSAYRRDCITIGQDVRILRGDRVLYAHADGIDENAALLVTLADGSQETISSGEVSVRGMYGYV